MTYIFTGQKVDMSFCKEYLSQNNSYSNLVY